MLGSIKCLLSYAMLWHVICFVMEMKESFVKWKDLSWLVLSSEDLSSASGEELLKAKNSSEDFGDETYMSSAQWLRLHGVQAKRLGFYDVLSSVAFRHQDGVIDLKVPPSDRCQISEAVSTSFFLHLTSWQPTCTGLPRDSFFNVYYRLSEVRILRFQSFILHWISTTNLNCVLISLSYLAIHMHYD